MPKHHPYSRRDFRRRWRLWLRRNQRLVAVSTVGLIGLIAVSVGVLTLLPDSGFRWWLMGALPTALVAGYFHLIHTAFLAHDANAIWHVRGAWSEDNTRSELQRAKRKRLVWGWVDSLGLQQGDIDHLVVTRMGGLVAVDSKWRSQVHDRAEMARAAHRMRLRAEALTRDLLKGDSRGTRRARVNPLSVTSVVVLWGAAQHGVPDGAKVDGIEFIAGRRFMDWLGQLDRQPVDRRAAAGIVRSLELKRAATDQARSARVAEERATRRVDD
ncbi:hypothetical protein [Nocardioides sp. SYSU D00065]|uniref:hypothetical protein n=1 Tax=Nocardioides sp. SYSU D00065 TaxID=2817378 RepID=UPI001B323D98|nr:hypothetical protein [Nocardioides sp. SYSU D00065]